MNSLKEFNDNNDNLINFYYENQNNSYNTHIGGNNDDNDDDIVKNKKIIQSDENLYENLLDFQNTFKKDKNNSYLKEKWKEFTSQQFRFNSFPTYIDDINISNPLVIPKDYDPFIEYLFNKNLTSLDNQVIKQKTYFNIDSNNRNKKTILNVTNYINLQDNSLVFTNNKNFFRIYFNNKNNEFKQEDFIILRGFGNYTNSYNQFNFIFENKTNIVITELEPNFLFSIPYYDVIIKISNVQNINNSFKNISLDLINQKHKLFIIEYQGNLRLAFNIPITFYSDNNYSDILTSNCTINFYNLGNYPINLLNAFTPLDENYLTPYFIINEATDNYIQIKLNNIISINKNIILEGVWNNNNFYTGKSVQIGKVINYSDGFYNPNSYSIELDKKISNIYSIKIISSEIPNVNKNIHSNASSFSNSFNINNVNLFNENNIINNKFYWQNILDDNIYSISIPSGSYNYDQLKIVMENTISKIPIINYKKYNLYEFNNMEIIFNESNSISSIILYNLFILPNSFIELRKDNDITVNRYFIKINHPYNNLFIGDTVYITNAIDYYTISAIYINDTNGHKVVNVINKDIYEIEILNINEIPDIGDTKGGFSTKIKTRGIFRLFFNYEDTFGDILGFSYVGFQDSITSYSSNKFNYVINNKQPYYIDFNKILTVNKNIPDIINNKIDFDINNNNYIFLLIDGLNINYNPNSIKYTYKFLLTEKNDTLFNTFVNSPLYFNPPLKILDKLNITWVNSFGELIDFYNRNHSFTLEITSINNYPVNTNNNTFVSKT
jgi:hypothetical protein